MMKSIEMSSDNHFLDNLQNLDRVALGVVKERWDAYSQHSAWTRAHVGSLDPSGELRIHGVVIRGQQLKDLTRDLHRYQCRVNRNGFSIHASSNTGENKSYLRLNEMFPWYKYGVMPRFDDGTTTVLWDRLELSNDRKVIVDSSGGKAAEVEALKKRGEELRREIQEGNRVFKEKEAEWSKKEGELSRLIHDRDEALKEKEAQLNKKTKAIHALKSALATFTD